MEVPPDVIPVSLFSTRAADNTAGPGTGVSTHRGYGQVEIVGFTVGL